MSSYISINNLKVNYETYKGFKNVLDIESLQIEKGETLGIVGESESGKSVLALTILRILSIPPGIIENGEILLEGEDLLQKKEKEMKSIRGKKIAMIFQDPMSTLNPVIKVGKQIKNVLHRNQGLSGDELDKKALEMVEVVRLPDAARVMNKYPHELSGGQRQRIIIALALSCGAEMLIADEPTRNLDVTIQSGILRLIDELKKKFNITVLFLTNNLTLVPVMSDRVGVIYQGKIMELGKVGKVINDPRHPYTRMMIQAMPTKEKKQINLSNIITEDGEKVEGGCKYYNRCRERTAECKTEIPVLREIDEFHYVSCIRINSGGENNG